MINKTLSPELTNEEIAKVFAMYWGSPLNAGLITKVDSYWIKKIAHGETDTKLLLTPLDKITNEHKREVSNLKYDDHVFQYLKSKDYAVPLWFGIDHPHNGKTALELNLAIEKI